MPILTARLQVLDSWRPTDPPLTNGTDNRAASSTSRWSSSSMSPTTPGTRRGTRGHETYCNIFLWDVTKAMCARSRTGSTPTATRSRWPREGAQRERGLRLAGG